MSEEAQNEVPEKKIHLPLPDEIQKRNLDTRKINYVQAPVGGQINLGGDSQLGIQGASIGVMPNIQRFLGDKGTYFSKGQPQAENFSAVDINTYKCDCGGGAFSVIRRMPAQRAMIVRCSSCGNIYGLVPENAQDFLSSQAAQYMNQEEQANVIARMPKTNMYIVFSKGG